MPPPILGGLESQGRGHELQDNEKYWAGEEGRGAGVAPFCKQQCAGAGMDPVILKKPDPVENLPESEHW